MRTIAVVSGKGGVGKTTVTSNLGVLLASAHQKDVLVADANLTTSHLGLYLGMDYTPVTLNHVLRGEATVSEAMYNHATGMRVLPASFPAKEMEGVDVSLLKGVVEDIARKYGRRLDFLLLDCAPGLGRDALAGIRAADELLYVTTPYHAPLMDVVRASHLVRDLGHRHAGVVLNMVEKGKHQLARPQAEQMVGLPILAEVPADTAVLRSLAANQPVALADPKAKASRSLALLAHALLQQGPHTPSYGGPHDG